MNNEAFNRFLKFLRTVRLGWIVPFILLARGESPREQLRAIVSGVVIPLLAIAAFLVFWSICSRQIVTKFGTVPGPRQVMSAWGTLMNEIRAEKIKERDHARRARQRQLDQLERYESVLEQAPGGPPELGNLAEVRAAAETVATAFEAADEVLDVSNQLTVLESDEAAEEVIAGLKFDSSKPVAETIREKLLPLEIAFRAAQTRFNTDPAINPQPDDDEATAESKAAAKKRAAKTLAAQKSELLIARQQMSTLALESARERIDSVPRATRSVLTAFDRRTAEDAPRLTAWYEEVVAAEEAGGAKFADKVKLRILAKSFESTPYPGKDTYLNQIATSLKTVFFGFVIASLVAIPIGIVCGLNKNVNNAINPLIQIFKPVSPLAWLPIVMIVVGALYVSDDPMFELSFINSAITVALCSLWPTLVNTAVGVASTDKDFLNVARVLKLGWTKKIYKVILPSSLPLVFTGLRLSLGVGWMVLIAAEMLAQNPGLGKFVWDMFQNGSSETLSMIMVAVITIGVIGFFLDTVMLSLQQLVSFGEDVI